MHFTLTSVSVFLERAALYGARDPPLKMSNKSTSTEPGLQLGLPDRALQTGPPSKKKIQRRVKTELVNQVKDCSFLTTAR